MATLAILLSDLHFGKSSDKYSLSIADRRIRTLVGKVANQPGLPEFSRIAVCLMGDIVEGEDIYPGQNAALQNSVREQKNAAASALWFMLLQLRKRWPDCKIDIYCVAGNHGRMSKTANADSNWDNEVYDALSGKIMARQDPALQIQIAKGTFLACNIGKARVILTHKGVKHLGTPAMRIKVMRWLKRYKAKVLCHGHWHQAAVTPLDDLVRVSNGSLCGPDDLGDKLAAYDPARQMMFTAANGKLAFFTWLEW